MYVIIMLLSFFITLNASEDGVVNLEGYMQIIGANLKGNYSYRATALPLDHYARDLITTYLPNGNGGYRIQLVHDPDHKLFENYCDFAPPQEIVDKGVSIHRLAGGTHTVAACSIDDTSLFCFKKSPELPGSEIAVRKLYEALISDEDVPMPRSQAIVMNGQCFLVSEFIHGIPLRKFLRLMQREPKNYALDPESFQKLFIFCMLANFEDCRLENCLVRKKFNGLYEIILIDTERSLGREFVTETQKGKNDGTRVHCVLFCFLEMMLSPVSIRLFIEEYERVQKLLLVLVNENRYQLSLHGKLIQQKEDEQTILGINLGEEFVINLNEKCRKIKDIISQGRSLAEIFLYVTPGIAAIYLYRTDLTTDVLKQCELVDSGRNIKCASTPRSANCPLNRYICWNVDGKRDVEFILTENSSLTFNQAIDKLNGYNCNRVYGYDYYYYCIRDIHDNLLRSLVLILQQQHLFTPGKKMFCGNPSEKLEQFFRAGEEAEFEEKDELTFLPLLWRSLMSSDLKSRITTSLQLSIKQRKKLFLIPWVHQM